MATITFNIPDNKVSIITEALCNLYTIPQINTGTVANPIWTNEFNNNQWSKECIRRWVIKQIARYTQRQSISNIVYNEDNNLLT